MDDVQISFSFFLSNVYDGRSLKSDRSLGIHFSLSLCVVPCRHCFILYKESICVAGAFLCVYRVGVSPRRRWQQLILPVCCLHCFLIFFPFQRQQMYLNKLTVSDECVKARSDFDLTLFVRFCALHEREPRMYSASKLYNSKEDDDAIEGRGKGRMTCRWNWCTKELST